MKAAQVAAILKDAGFNIVEVSEADRLEDGNVSINPDVHVSVQLCGLLCTVRQKDGLFHFGHDRKEVTDIITDLRAIEDQIAAEAKA